MERNVTQMEKCRQRWVDHFEQHALQRNGNEWWLTNGIKKKMEILRSKQYESM